MAALLVFQALRSERSARRLLERQHELETHSRAFFKLSSKAAVFGVEDSDSFKQITEIITDAINLRRTSLWHFDNDGRVLKCVDSYDRESNGHTHGTVLDRSEFSALFDLLQNGEDISTGNAEADSRLTELFQLYLQPLGCKSLLAVPIRFGDWTAGVLWFEHERMLQDWPGEEVSFAHAIANMLALRFSADRKTIPAQAGRKDEITGAKDSAASGTEEATPARDMRSEPDLAKMESADESVNPASTDETGPLPSFSDRLAAGGIVPDQSAADIFTDTTVLALRFTDPISLAVRIADQESTTMVDLMVAYLEEAVAALSIEYLKIMGEEIICAAGIGPSANDHARRIADLALNLQNHCTGLFTSLNTTMKFQIGIDTGAVMGCEVGREPKIYNIWGESTRFASKMAETGIAGGIHVSQTTYQRLRANYLFQMRGRYYLPNIGETSTYLLTGRI